MVLWPPLRPAAGAPRQPPAGSRGAPERGLPRTRGTRRRDPAGHRPGRRPRREQAWAGPAPGRGQRLPRGGQLLPRRAAPGRPRGQPNWSCKRGEAGPQPGLRAPRPGQRWAVAPSEPLGRAGAAGGTPEQRCGRAAAHGRRGLAANGRIPGPGLGLAGPRRPCTRLRGLCCLRRPQRERLPGAACPRHRARRQDLCGEAEALWHRAPEPQLCGKRHV
mmetsp:Transcript_109624/g.353887  ORF Transcript_109624/g.353887 Transcript_109624/m.353887 type:complete len:218 (-) Transcript_109624:1078-1731(-)